MARRPGGGSTVALRRAGYVSTRSRITRARRFHHARLRAENIYRRLRKDAFCSVVTLACSGIVAIADFIAPLAWIFTQALRDGLIARYLSSAPVKKASR